MKAPGIYLNVPIEQYHSEKFAIGCSGLKAMLKAPAYYFGQYLDPNCPPESERESPGRRFGNMVHAQLFEHESFAERYRVGPEVTSKALKAWKDFASTLPEGVEPITPAEYKTMQQVRRSALTIPDIASALAVGDGEVSAYAVDDETGVMVKVRPDWVHPAGPDSCILLDGKTFNTADTDEFTRQAARMSYSMQAALYSDFYAKASGKKVLGFVFLVIADEFPNLCNAVMLDDESLQAGRRLYRKALNQYAECMKSGVWPGHGGDVKVISLPKWAMELA